MTDDQQDQRRQELFEMGIAHFEQAGEPHPGTDRFGDYAALIAEQGDMDHLNDCFQRIAPHPDSHSNAGDWGFFLLVNFLNLYHKHSSELEPASVDHFEEVLAEACRPRERIYRIHFEFNNTNWPFCCATIEVLGGEILGDDEIIASGLTKFREYARKLATGPSGTGYSTGGYCGTVSEFNSPVYAGINLMALSVLENHSRIPEASAMGELLKEFVLMDILDHWHPPTQQFGGPHSRAYMGETIGATGLAKLFLHQVLPGGTFEKAGHPWKSSGVLAGRGVAAIEMSCPEYLVALAQENSYPCEQRIRTEVNGSGSGIGHIPAGETDTYCYMTDVYTLGSSTCPLGSGTDTPIVRWQTDAPVMSMEDHKTLFFRYLRDDAVPFEDDIGETGYRNVVHHENVALTVYRPHMSRVSAESTLKCTGFVPLAQDVDAVYLGEDRVDLTERPAQSEDPVPIIIEDGPVVVGIYPVALTDHGRDHAVRLERENDFLIGSLYNYAGEDRKFTAGELLETQNGVITVVESRTNGEAVDRLRDRLTGATVDDNLVGGNREVHYSDEEVTLSAEIALDTGRFQQRQINGNDPESVVYESSNIGTAGETDAAIGDAVLTVEGETPLRLLGAPSIDTYVVYNFYPEASDFILQLDDTSVREASFGRGKMVFRRREGNEGWESDLVGAHPPHQW